MKIRIRKNIEIHDTCAIIDPQRSGLDVVGTRIERGDMVTCYDAVIEKVIDEVREELEAQRPQQCRVAQPEQPKELPEKQRQLPESTEPVTDIEPENE